MFKKITIIFLLLLILVACGHVHKVKETKTLIALDTIINIETYGKNAKPALKEVEAKIFEIEEELSRTLKTSDLFLLNTKKTLENPKPELIELLEKANDYYELTDHAFDITIATIADLWGFTKSEHQVPNKDIIEANLVNVGPKHIHIEDHKISLDAGTKLDLGGIAKGLLAKETKTIYDKYKLQSAFVNLGGDILVYGYKDNNDDWSVGIQNPYSANDTNSLSAILSLHDAYIFTSGNYQRYFEVDGVRYHHIIDPKTGYPANNNLLSVSIITNLEDDNAIMADALSTALFVMGQEEAINLWHRNQDLFDVIIINNENEVLATKNLEDKILLANDNFNLKIID